MALFWRKSAHRKVKGDSKKELTKQLLWGFLFLAVVALLIYGIWYVTRLQSVTISEIEIEGGETVSHENTKSIVESELEGDYMFVIPKRFSLTYPKDEIIKQVSDVDRVYGVSVVEDGNNKIIVTFKEHSPFALLCESAVDDSRCFFINKEGFAFGEAPQMSGSAFIRYVVDGIELEKGVRAISEERFDNILEFISVLDSEFGFRVNTVSLDSYGDITYGLSKGGELRIATDKDAQDSLENLQSILQSPEFEHIEPGNFNYIDLRFGNKVFVKEGFDIGTTTDEVIEEVTEEEDEI